MKRTFFDYISSASEEKIHSQTLGWLLSKNCDALEEQNKKELLLLLLGKKNTIGNDFNIEDVLVEYFDIDLLIVCDKFVAVIENKLKSSEHSNQLEKYILLVKKDIDSTRLNNYLTGLSTEKNCAFIKTRENIQASLKKRNESSYFVYLNFINKNASNDQYNNITYIEILDFLKNIKPTPPIKTDATILESYKTSLENLKKCRDEFGLNADMRRWVAENSKFNKKDMLLNESSFPSNLNSEIMTYVIENNLINTIQLNFLNQVVNGLLSSIKEESTKFEINASLSQTRQGIIHIKFKEMEFEFMTVKCNFGYQIQIGPNKGGLSNGTQKIAITTNKINHKVLIKIESRFRKALEKEEKFKYWSRNGIKKNGSKGNYISISKTFEDSVYFTNLDVEGAINHIQTTVLDEKSFIYTTIVNTHSSMRRTQTKLLN